MNLAFVFASVACFYGNRVAFLVFLLTFSSEYIRAVLFVDIHFFVLFIVLPFCNQPRLTQLRLILSPVHYLLNYHFYK